MKLTIEAPEVISINITYSTNLFGYPFFQVTGLSNCNTIFNSVFGLIVNKTIPSFRFLAKVTKELRARGGITANPDIIVTDKCKKLKQAFLEVFPNS